MSACVCVVQSESRKSATRGDPLTKFTRPPAEEWKPCQVSQKEGRSRNYNERNTVTVTKPACPGHGGIGSPSSWLKCTWYAGGSCCISAGFASTAAFSCSYDIDAC